MTSGRIRHPAEHYGLSLGTTELLGVERKEPALLFTGYPNGTDKNRPFLDR